MFKVKPRVKMYLFGLFSRTVYDLYYGQNHTVAKLMSDGGGEPYEIYLEHKRETFNSESEAEYLCSWLNYFEEEN